MALSLHDALASWDEVASGATTYTVTSGATALILCIGQETNDAPLTLDSVVSSIDGALTIVRQVHSNSGANGNTSAIAYLANPTAGAHGFTISFSDTVNTTQVFALTLEGDFYGVLSDGEDSGQPKNAMSIGSLTFDANSFGVAYAQSGNDGAAPCTADGDWTERYDDNRTITTSDHVQTRDYAGAGTDTVSATFTGGSYNRESMVAVVFDGTPPPAVTRATLSVQVDRDGDGTWTDDAAVVTLMPPVGREITIRRGNEPNQPIVPPRVTECSYELDNQDGDYSVGSTVAAGKPTRVRATWASTTYELFEGLIETVNYDSAIARQATAIRALGPGGQFAGKTGFSTALYTNIRVDVAIGHVLDAVGFPSGKRVLDTATRSVPYFWLSPTMDPWRVLVELVNFEGPLAQLYGDGERNLVFEAQDYRSGTTRSNSTQETFRGSTTEPVFSRLLRYDDGLRGVVNQVSIPWRMLTTTTQPTILYSDYVNVTSATVPWSLPGGLQDDDVLIALCTTHDAGGGTRTITLPTGWTTHPSGLDADGSMTSRCATARYSDLTPGTQTWTINSAVETMLVVVVVRGITDFGNVYAYTLENASNSSPLTLGASITVDAADELVLVVTSNTSGSAPNAPSGYTALVRQNNAEVGVGAYYQLTPDATDLAFSAGYSGDWAHAYGFTLKPAGTTVWSYGGDIVLGNNESITIPVETTDGLPFTGAITPVEDGDFEITAGALASGPTLNRTSGSAATITMTADSAGATISGRPNDSAEGIRLRATKYTLGASGAGQAEDSTSITAYEERGLRGYGTWQYVDADDAQDLADDVLAALKDPRPVAVIEIVGDRASATLTSCLEREISDAVRVIEARASIDINYGWVEAIEHRFGVGGVTRTTLSVKKAV